MAGYRALGWNSLASSRAPTLRISTSSTRVSAAPQARASVRSLDVGPGPLAQLVPDHHRQGGHVTGERVEVDPRGVADQQDQRRGLPGDPGDRPAATR